MIKAPEISFRNVDHSPAIESAVVERINKLERICDPIGCTVTIDAPHRQHQKGRIYNIGIDLTLAGAEIVVNRDPQKDHSHEDIYVAIRDAFNAAERQVKKVSERRRGEIKHHEMPPNGIVAELFEDQGYGFIDADDGRRIYFHHNAVAEGDFEELEIGNRVEFVEVDGDEGPQASTVKPTTLQKLG